MRLLGAALLTLVLTTSGSARTWYITADGTGDAPTIQAAVDAATDGDEIRLANGTFTGPGNRDVTVRDITLTIGSVSGNANACVIDIVDSPFEDWHWGIRFEFSNGHEMILEDVTIKDGRGVDGGAITIGGASPTIRRCILRDNVAWQGGAINCYNGSPLIEDCVVVDNFATQFPGGGMMFLVKSHPTIRGCTIARSWSGKDPGGICDGGGIAVHSYSSCTIENSIIASSRRGEGVACDATSWATLSCCDVFGNAGGDWIGCIADQANTAGNFSAAPRFCDPSIGDFTLRADLPCAPPGVTGCGLVGALPVGCGPVSVEPSSWGKVKGAYR